MAEIRWTHESERWLKEIHDFLSEVNPAAATRTIDGILQKTEILKSFPEIGYRLQEYSDRHIRVLLYGHYRIVYLVKPNRDVDILGVFHGAMDLNRYLAPE